MALAMADSMIWRKSGKWDWWHNVHFHLTILGAVHNDLYIIVIHNNPPVSIGVVSSLIIQ
jgi:hypothetical protein